jgi:hypothetical protein
MRLYLIKLTVGFMACMVFTVAGPAVPGHGAELETATFYVA